MSMGRAAGALAVVALALAAAARAELPPVRAVAPAQFAAELDALRGRVVMLNVWATWCAPCLKEIPDLLAVEADLAGEGFVLLGLSIDDAADAARVEQLRRQYFPAFRSLQRDASDADALVRVVDGAWNEVVPTTYLIGRDGRVLQRIQGKQSRAQFAAAARTALAVNSSAP